VTAAPIASPVPEIVGGAPDTPKDHRGSWVPTLSLITTRMMEIRKRRGLMIALLVVNIGIPGVFLTVRLLAHAFAPKSYGPAGGYSVFTGLVAGLMYVFGFIVAAVVGCSAGSTDLTDGMFRHLVVTGRSRLALYLARIPAGLAVVLPIVAAGFAMVCVVCVLAAPTVDSYQGVSMPAGLTLNGFEHWVLTHPNKALCQFPYNNINNMGCGSSVQIKPGSPPPPGQPTPAQLRAALISIAEQNYQSYSDTFLKPPGSLMIDAGLWILLEATIGFIVGLGLSSLLGQRTIAVVLMIVLELILTPIFSRAHIPHFINFQRGFVGLAMAHIEPPALPLAFGGDMNGASRAMQIVPESTEVAIIVIVVWLVFWTVIGGWRMVKRDA
jgi:hypothetical protein